MDLGSENPFPIVGIGASAGGLGALRELMTGLPPQPGLALVIIQHLDPHSQSRLTSLLQPHTSMAVVDALHGSKIEPNHAYVIQPNTNVAIADGVLSVTPRSEDRRPHYPVDHFLRSLAAVKGPQSIGVVLSGTGSDGTLGVCEIRAAGGLTFAQDEQSAEHAGMPQSAVASGAIDAILAPAEIGAKLGDLLNHPFIRADVPDPVEASEDDFQRVIAALRRTSGVDFSQYRDTTLKRRTARRMMLRGFVSPIEYAEFVEADRDEADALYRDVLINVTSFFRDPAVFEDLKREVFPAIVANLSERVPIRVWAPGCSTGQETYSIAIALLEFLDSTETRRPLQVFATDLGDPASLDKARAGLYPESIEAEVSPERLRRFFTKEDHSYRIQKHVRDICVFARQNITVDPPFSRVDLIMCRNVLIYMSQPLQERLLPVFHFALNANGFLVLGLAETVGRFGDLFELVNRVHKIYRRKEASRRPTLTFMTEDWHAGGPRRPKTMDRAPDLVREAERVLLAHYAPPSVLVNQDFEIQQFRGPTATFLEAPFGQPTTNILRMAKEGLFVALRSALTEAMTAKVPVVREGLRVAAGGADVEFTLRILPLRPAHTGESALLVLFETQSSRVWSVPAPPAETPSSERDVSWLQQELSDSKQYLQSIVDQQETDAHELRAAHEEVLSSNEELQSTNEELETTKEELQSANEELTTVNEQFQTRNRELDALTDDLSNFIASADLPLVTVGRDLSVRRLTPAARMPFNLIATDVGRSIEHVKFSFTVDGLADIIEGVIASGEIWERDVTDRNGRWWVLRIRPYRTTDSRIDGVTMVAVDIDVIRRSHELMEARDTALAIVQTVREPLVVLDGDCRVVLANEAFYGLFGGRPSEMERRFLWDSDVGVWSDPLRQTLLSACSGEESFQSLEIERALPGRGRRVLSLNARGIVREGRARMLLLAIEDVTAAREAEALRIDAETLRLIDRKKDEFFGTLAHELRNPLAPMRFALEIMRRSEPDSPQAARARKVLERQVTHLARIVDDLLDVSRITQGKVELRLERLELEPIVANAVELCQPLVDAAHHVLTVSLPDEPVWLKADAIRLTQILVNLLNNAVKFTPPGGHIWVIAEKVGEEHRSNILRLRVRDTGIGIAPSVLPRIFDMFTQGDRSLERTRGGLGVGLTLVRNLVAQHGGRVEARSDGPESGAEFTVSLPIDPEEQPQDRESAVPALRAPARALRILVADDNEDAAEMLSFFLRHEGHTVATAGDGPSALAVAADFNPDVAILDIGMPGLTGYAVAERLRAAPNGAELVLIALSGLGQEADKSRAVQAGFDQYFTKPVQIDTLVAFLGNTLTD